MKINNNKSTIITMTKNIQANSDQAIQGFINMIKSIQPKKKMKMCCMIIYEIKVK